MNRFAIRVWCVALTFVLPNVAAAEFDAQQLADTISPYVDQETVVIAHVDLARIDVGESIKMISTLIPPTIPDREDAEQKMEMVKGVATAFRDQLKEVGATEVFVTASVADFMRQTFNLIVPVAEGGNHDQIASLLFCGRADGPSSREQAKDQNVRVGSNFEVCQRVDSVVYCGTVANLNRLPYSINTRADREMLASAFRQAGDSDGQLLVFPAEPFRVLREMDPDLPDELGGLSGRDVADGIQWMAVAANVPPKPSIRVTLQSTDKRAAKVLQAAIENGLDWIAARPEVRKIIPDPLEIKKILNPKQEGRRLVTTVNDASIEQVAHRLMAGLSAPLQLQARQNQSIYRLKMLALAMWNFESSYGSFAPPTSYSDDGKELLSWRVYMLPFLEEGNDLYKRFRLNEPWDSPHNRELISEMPDVFLSKGLDDSKDGKTGFLLPTAKGTAFHGKKGTVIRDIKDGTSKTIMIAEAAPEHAVIWTKPDDWQVNLKEPTDGLVGDDDEHVTVAFCDGSVQVLPVTIDANRLRLLLLIADGERVER